MLGGLRKMEAPELKVYGWLNEALESLERGRPDAPLLSETVGPLTHAARPFSLPPYTMSDPPYMGYLFESEPAVSYLEEYHQPFPVIALQFPILGVLDRNRYIRTVAVVSHDEQKQELFIFQASKHQVHSDWTWYPAGLSVLIKGPKGPLELNKLAISPINFRNRPLSHDQEQFLVNAMNPAVMATYEVAVLLQCQNVSIVRMEAPKEINEKRKRKSKRPLPDGYVIRVSRDVTRLEYDREEDEENPERTRTSPRTHFRRGHIRRLRSGGRVWISPAIVNPGSTPLDSKYQILF